MSGTWLKLRGGHVEQPDVRHLAAVAARDEPAEAESDEPAPGMDGRFVGHGLLARPREHPHRSRMRGPSAAATGATECFWPSAKEPAIAQTGVRATTLRVSGSRRRPPCATRPTRSVRCAEQETASGPAVVRPSRRTRRRTAITGGPARLHPDGASARRGDDLPCPCAIRRARPLLAHGVEPAYWAPGSDATTARTAARPQRAAPDGGPAPASRSHAGTSRARCRRRRRTAGYSGRAGAGRSVRERRRAERRRQRRLRRAPRRRRDTTNSAARHRTGHACTRRLRARLAQRLPEPPRHQHRRQPHEKLEDGALKPAEGLR